MTLTATSRPTDGWTARWTEPNAPSPITSANTYPRTVRPMTVYARKDRGIADAKDLKGKRIGTQWRITKTALANFLT